MESYFGTAMKVSLEDAKSPYAQSFTQSASVVVGDSVAVAPERSSAR
jgi:hypothetical protein